MMGASSFSELMVTLDRRSAEPLYRQLQNQIRRAILQGALAGGDRLPSVKSLAASAGVSHVTVERAYSLLAAEGLVVSKPRSGYRVTELEAPFAPPEDRTLGSDVRGAMRGRHPKETGYAHDNLGLVRYDFAYNDLEPGSFPVGEWLQIEREVLLDHGDIGMTRYESLEPANGLQEQIARLAPKLRGVRCEPDQVIVLPGWPVALRAVLALFDPRSHSFSVQSPGLTNTWEIAKTAGFETVPLPAESYAPDLLDLLEARRPDIFACIPADQWPLGRAMPPDERERLVEWAGETGCYLIENDTGSFLHYDGPALPTLYSLDKREHVIYFGSISDVLSPSLRIGFLVLPPSLLRVFNLKMNNPRPTPWHDTETLAAFMERGLFEKQVRTMARSNETKRERLIAHLEEELRDVVRIEGRQGNRYLAVSALNGMSHDELIESARARDVAIYGTRHFNFLHEMREERILLGFASMRLADIAPAVHELALAWSG